MALVIALLAPGQGSQTPGMLEPWLALPGARERLEAFSAVAGLDLVALGTTASAEEITDTAVTQPLVVAAALLAHEELERRGDVPADAVAAGHSVGELAAAVVAGVLTAEDAVGLAAVRGAAMARACAAEPTGMAALLGGAEDVVLARLAELDLVPANRNAAGQVVAAGAAAALDELVADPPAGARVRRLQVAGAFHTRYMASAQDAVAERAAQVAAADPTRTLLSNADGRPVTDGAEVLRRIVSQVTSPVRWDLCTAWLREAGVAALVELPPAGTLTGIAKRELRGTPGLAAKVPADLDGVAGLVPA